MEEVVAYPPLRVLIADDCADTTSSLAHLIRAWGHDPTEVNVSTEVLRLAVTCCPDVILLDIVMPGLNGWTLARELRKTPTLESVCLIAMSGWGGQDARERSQEAGFDHHLLKPFAVKELQRLLAKQSSRVRLPQVQQRSP